ncbi:hypothetical protein RhiirC2_860802 [Rhizophagus irregularis]|uniref:Uncharacterized protein n=1 Tax=Rhizophagus irregularis TaxID=588596 RepID=A0A2N1NZ10_9GLOM|nr:hypothetical protein RhiirC2_860802 [Rhizophagus irregularis]
MYGIEPKQGDEQQQEFLTFSNYHRNNLESNLKEYLSVIGVKMSAKRFKNNHSRKERENTISERLCCKHLFIVKNIEEAHITSERYAGCTYLNMHRFTVTPSAYNIETAIIAKFSYKGDLIAIGGVAAAIALKAIFEKHEIPGKVKLFGTPAEGKCYAKKKINKYSSGFWFKPDIFHPDYNPDEKPYPKKNIRNDPDTNRSTIIKY